MRRFAVRERDWNRVRDYLKKRATGTDKPEEKKSEAEQKEEEKMGEVPAPQQEKGAQAPALLVPAGMLPKIRWAHKAELKLQKGKAGRELVFAREGDGPWKRVLFEKEVDAYLRDALLNPKSVMPMSRDAGYHIMQKETYGISRRRFMQFLKKQSVVQLTTDVMPKQRKLGRPLQGRGYLELDLVEAKGYDISKWVHHPVKNFYFITLIDRLTGWLEVERALHKDVKTIAPMLRKMFRNMAKALKTDVKHVRSDKGSEFKADTQEVLRELGIRHNFVSSGSRIEKVNRDFQRAWYRLMRLGRGDLRELDVQAAAIVNNTKSQINGFTPLEALDEKDGTLATAFNEAHKKRKIPKYKAESIWDEQTKKGATVRYLITTVVGKHGRALGYKTYRGKHWSPEVYPVVKYNPHGAPDTYYVAGSWRARDQLLKVGEPDKETQRLVNERHRAKKKDWDEKLV